MSDASMTDTKSELTVRYRNPRDLKPSPGNPRTHSKKQIEKIKRSIQEYKFLNPILIDGSDRIIAGHGRAEAAKLAGLETVPTIRVDHLSHAQIKAFIIADNKLALNADWDDALLAAELSELAYNLDYDPTKTGFEVPELDIIWQREKAKAERGDEIPEPDKSKPVVSRPGDLWRIGNHMVFCGDSTQRSSFEKLMGNEAAQLVFTDAPYNVHVEGHVSGLGKHHHREFAMASGEMSADQFTTFLRAAFQHLADYSEDGSLHYLCMDWRHMWELMTAARGTYSELKNLCIWAKTNGGMGAFYRSQHELVFVYKKGTAPHINNIELGKHGRNRTNLWTYGGANAFGSSRDSDLAMHPTVKPLQLVADAILDASKPDDIVLDAFGGSGTTLVAAEQTGRRGRVIEFEPLYVDTIVKRMQSILKVEATLGHGTATFQSTAAWRASGIE